MSALEEIRRSVDRPFKINSGFRCYAHNMNVGGAITSRHMRGMAVDISTVGWSPDDLHYLMFEITSYQDVENLLSSGMGVYKSWIHFDLRPDKESAWVNL